MSHLEQKVYFQMLTLVNRLQLNSIKWWHEVGLYSIPKDKWQKIISLHVLALVQSNGIHVQQVQELLFPIIILVFQKVSIVWYRIVLEESTCSFDCSKGLFEVSRNFVTVNTFRFIHYRPRGLVKYKLQVHNK